MDIKKELTYKASEVEQIIYKYLPDENHGYQKNVFKAMNYSVMAGGKRLRPILMIETFKLFGGSTPAIEPFAAAMEMIHTYSLVHDDLPAMDNDMLRRGKPTTHAKFGEALGILAGDGLLNFAFETALGAFDLDPDNKDIPRALQVLAKKAGIYGMIGGQVADVEELEQYGISKNRIDFIYKLKTGALIEASMMIGAILAGATDEQVDLIEEVAAKIGLAFQIQDDILDVVGDTEVMGKNTGSDEENGKVTYIVFLGLDKSKDAVEQLSKEAVDLLKSLSYENPFLTELLLYLVHREK